MKKRLTAILGLTLLVSLAVVTTINAQTTQTTTVTKVQAVQNPDGTYTIVEYPVGKETIVTLNPVGIAGATGTAAILRDANGATIKVNLTSLPAEVATLHLYAVDPTGVVTTLGPVEIANGVGTFTTTTPLSKFMLVASPEASLTAYDANTKILFRSAVPTGLAVIPLSGPVGEKVAAMVAPTTTVAPTLTVAPTTVTPTTTVAPTTDYAVPMLGIPTFKKGDDTKLKVNFTGELAGARANIFILPEKSGSTKVSMRFHDLKEVPKGQTFILWAVTPEGEFQNLGQIVNLKERNEAEINSEVALKDFGLFLTIESVATTAIIKPSGHRVGVIEIIK